MTDLSCEICGATPAEDEGVWQLCSECHQHLATFLDWVKQYPDVKAKDLEGLKEALRAERQRRKLSVQGVAESTRPK